MTLKKIKIISIIGIFTLCFLFHFAYQLLPNGLFAIFFPVNESIWEHMKLIFSATMFWALIDYILLKKNKIAFNNFFTQLFLTSFLNIPIYLAMFLPIFHKIGDSMFINISLMAITIIIVQILSYYLLKSRECNLINYISIFLIIATYIIFGYLTYNPPHTELFFDTEDEKYGINNYNV